MTVVNRRMVQGVRSLVRCRVRGRDSGVTRIYFSKLFVNDVI
jgi:hypothetical protein